jgi:hypothetical protein
VLKNTNTCIVQKLGLQQQMGKGHASLGQGMRARGYGGVGCGGVLCAVRLGAERGWRCGCVTSIGPANQCGWVEMPAVP